MVLIKYHKKAKRFDRSGWVNNRLPVRPSGIRHSSKARALTARRARKKQTGKLPHNTLYIGQSKRKFQAQHIFWPDSQFQKCKHPLPKVQTPLTINGL